MNLIIWNSFDMFQMFNDVKGPLQGVLCTCENATAMTLVPGRLQLGIELAQDEARTLVIKPLAFVSISVGILKNTITSSSIIRPLACRRWKWMNVDEVDHKVSKSKSAIFRFFSLPLKRSPFE